MADPRWYSLKPYNINIAVVLLKKMFLYNDNLQGFFLAKISYNNKV